MAKNEKISLGENVSVPVHVGVIMDGNGRWAKKRGMPRKFGHREGAKTFRAITRHAKALGIQYITYYAFSTENWKRSEEEVSYLMALLKRYLIKNKKDAIRRNIQIRVLGDKSGLSSELQDLIQDVEEATRGMDSFHLQFAINYGGRDELCRAMRRIAAEGHKPEEITQEMVSEHLDTAEIPDPDLLIRTSGEQRISNFLLWQLAYSEFYFSDKYWPDFTPEDLEEAILDYAGRQRRFGGRKQEGMSC